MIEHACLRCGDLFYTVSDRLCLLCTRERDELLRQLDAQRQENPDRVERELEQAIRLERLPPNEHPRRRSMWEGHRE